MKSGATLIVFCLGFLTALNAADRGYGDPLESYPNYPNWQERALSVLTNACRMSPEDYRDEYIGSYSILLPENYPSVKPLYWLINLNRSARAHAIDMAEDCGLQHESCNGDSFHVRIRSYYSKSPIIGENIATSREMPQETMRQWIMDGNPPATDLSGPAGHRTNIMNSKNREMGAGYGYGSVRYYHFWVQDFGGGWPEVAYPIPDGSHIFNSDDSIRFLVNYYDSSGRAPSESWVVLNGQKLALQLHLGNGEKGTYMRDERISQVCRDYYFLIRDADGNEWRYPEYGTLVTYGEGDCEIFYYSQDEVVISDESMFINFSINKPSNTKKNVLLVDLYGRVVNRRNITRHGVYFLRQADNRNKNLNKLIITVR